MDINFFILIFFVELLLFLIIIYLLIKASDWVKAKESHIKAETKQLLYISISLKEMLRTFNKSFKRILGLNAFDITEFVYFTVQLYSDLRKLTKVKGGFLAKLHIVKIIAKLIKNKTRFLATIEKFN